MEIAKCCFVFFITVISILSSETSAYGPKRIRKEIEAMKDGISFIREDITTLFDKMNQLNISAVEDCALCVTGNKTSCPPVMGHDGRQDMAKMNDNSMLVKYQSLMKAFVTEKKINREQQDQLRAVEDILSASKKAAKKRDQEEQGRLKSMEDIISDIHNNMTLTNQARELMDLEQQLRLQSVVDTISAHNKVANERDRQVQDQLRSMEDTFSESKKVTNERNRQVQDQLRSMRESIEDLHNNISSFFATISNRIDEHLLKTETTSVKPVVTTVPIINTNCTTVPESGVYTFYLELIMSNFTVYCDQDTDGGGWIVFMRRQDGSVNFSRPWVDYKHGFGSHDSEFWAGNELLYKLTKARPLQLRIDMEDFDGNTAFAMYEEFQVGAEEDKYRLHVRWYSGTAGDSLIDTISVIDKHAGMQFSTFDSDNDEWEEFNCAKNYKGGWWYNSCGDAMLTNEYHKKAQWPKGIIWYSWKGWDEALRSIEMKIR